MVRPSRLHTGSASGPGETVSRVEVSRSRSQIQMSCSSSRTSRAIRVPSGDRRGQT